jgi:outer membrane lipoprotein-sorting protein
MARTAAIALYVTTLGFLAGCSETEPVDPKVAEAPQSSAAGFFDAPTITIKDARAKEVVGAMYAAYASCKTYMDTGTVKFEDSTAKFETRFKRPYGFYFEFTSTGGPVASGRHVLWTHGDRTKFSGDTFGMKYEEDTVLTDMWPEMPMLGTKDQPLGLAIASFTGISYRSAHTVPRMLFPVSCKETGNYATMPDLVHEGTKSDRGAECDVLFSKEWGERIWIDSKTRLLRRVETDQAVGSMRYVTTTVYSPKVDTEIRDEQLTFVPPR